MFTATPKRPSSAATPATTPFASQRNTPFAAHSRQHTPGPKPLLSSHTPGPHHHQQQPQQPVHLLSHDTHSVLLLSSLPESLQAFPTRIQDSGLLVHSSLGHIVFELHQNLYVWNCRKTTYPCIELPLPKSRTLSASVATFVPTWDPQQVGLLVVTAEGLVRLWENLSLGADKDFVDMLLNFQKQDEHPKLLTQVWASTYLLATNKNLYRISISNQMGACTLSHSIVQLRSSGMLARFVPFSLTGTDPITEGIVKLLPLKKQDARHSREICILGKDIIQKWSMAHNEIDKMIYQVSIRNLIQKSIERDLATDSYVELLVLLEDAAVVSNDMLAILAKFTLDQGMSYFVLVYVNIAQDLSIVEKRQISHRQPFEIKERARLGFVDEGPILFIFFKSAIMLLSSLLDNDFEQIVYLQNQENRVLGFDAFYQKSISRDFPEKAIAVLICSDPENTVLQVEVHTPIVYASRIEEQMEKSIQNLKVNLEQAIFFGSKDDLFVNPLSFEITEATGDIEKVSLDVSEAILKSESRHIHPSLDLRTQIMERVGRLDQIINYAIDNQVLEMITEPSRWKLCSNVEKLVACLSLWQYLNSLLSDGLQHKPAHFGVLSKAITDFVHSKGVKDDVIKTFFRSYASEVADLMEWIQSPIRRQLPANYREDYALLVHESSKLFTIIYSQALEYREENVLRYGLGEGPVSDPWIASTQCLSILQSQYELIEAVLSKFPDITHQYSQSMTMDTDETSDFSGFPDKLQSALRQHLCDMADHLLGAYRDRIYYLKSLQSPESLLELQNLEQKSRMLQSKLIMPLVQYGRKTSAYLLAEKYRDFQILVDLSLQDAHKESRIDDYIHRFQEEFTQVLFTTYYQRGMYLDLMQQKAEYQDHLDRFLEQAQLPWLAWIQDVNAGRFDQAFNNLLLVVSAEQSIDKKKLSISLAKLAFLSYFEDDYEESPQKENSISYLEKLLELVEVQEAIRSEFVKPFGSSTPVDVVGRVVSTRFKKIKRDYPIFSLVVTNSLKKLLQGQVLSSNELVDVLTLVDDPTSLDAFVGSMEILYRSVPPFEDPLLIRNRIWRRAFLSTDWEKLCKLSKKVSDDELRSRLSETSVYKLLEYIYQPAEDGNEMLKQLIMEPDQIPMDVTVASIGIEYPSLSGDQVLQMFKEYDSEQSLLQEGLQSFQLGAFFKECLSLVGQRQTFELQD